SSDVCSSDLTLVCYRGHAAFSCWPRGRPERASTAPGRHRERHVAWMAVCRAPRDAAKQHVARVSEAHPGLGGRAPGALRLPGLRGYSPSAAATNGGSFSAAWWMSAL